MGISTLKCWHFEANLNHRRSGSPPTLIPTLWNIDILLHKQAKLRKDMQHSVFSAFWGSQSKMENFNNSNWVLIEKGVLNVYCFYFQLEYFSTQVFYLKIFGFFYQVVYNLIFSFAVNDFLKFGS